MSKTHAQFNWMSFAVGFVVAVILAFLAANGLFGSSLQGLLSTKAPVLKPNTPSTVVPAPKVAPKGVPTEVAPTKVPIPGSGNNGGDASQF